MNTLSASQDKKYVWVIGAISIVIPLVVAFLLFMPQTGKLGDVDVSLLPHFNALLNTLTASCLVAGFVAIKSGYQRMHRNFMSAAFVFSSIFLISYVIYHFQGTATLYGDYNHDGLVTDVEKAQVGQMRSIYLLLLLSHIVLATAVVPFVLLALYFAFTAQFVRHKKIVKWTFPIWTYVAISGVLVYWMISPFYQ